MRKDDMRSFLKDFVEELIIPVCFMVVALNAIEGNGRLIHVSAFFLFAICYALFYFYRRRDFK